MSKYDDYSIDHMNAHICPDGKIRYEHPCSYCKELNKKQVKEKKDGR